MLSHECEFVPASLLDGACPVMLSSSSQGCFPSSQASQHRPNFKVKRGTEQIMQPCNALMSCHAIILRQTINLDHLSCHNIIGRFFSVPRCGLVLHSLADICVKSACLLAAGTRRWRRGKRGREDCDGGQRLGQRMLIPQGALVLWEVSFFL